MACSPLCGLQLLAQMPNQQIPGKYELVLTCMAAQTNTGCLFSLAFSTVYAAEITPTTVLPWTGGGRCPQGWGERS